MEVRKLENRRFPLRRAIKTKLQSFYFKGFIISFDMWTAVAVVNLFLSLITMFWMFCSLIYEGFTLSFVGVVFGVFNFFFVIITFVTSFSYVLSYIFLWYSYQFLQSRPRMFSWLLLTIAIYLMHSPTPKQLFRWRHDMGRTNFIHDLIVVFNVLF